MDNKQDVIKQFGQNPESYVESAIHREGKDLQMLVEMASLQGGEKFLDIATGGGHTANIFAPLVTEVAALDLTEGMLKAAENFIRGNGHQNVTFIQGDAENLPFPDRVFDIAACRIASHHFSNVKGFVREVQRVLKQGGQFLLDDNVAPEDDELDQFYNTIEKCRDYSHFRAWKKSEWVRMLECGGFDLVEMRIFRKTFYFEKWCRQMNLPEKEKINLNRFILASNEKINNHFHIVIEDGLVLTFQGEAVLIKAVVR